MVVVRIAGWGRKEEGSLLFKQLNKRQAKIDSLVGDRRDPRKKLRKARTDMEEDGY